jgi:hypothetical protein
MPERDLTGVPGDQVEADAADRVDDDQRREAHQVTVEGPRQRRGARAARARVDQRFAGVFQSAWSAA